jgi:SPP1 gp7 family putative phage head morphogenesis protein
VGLAPSNDAYLRRIDRELRRVERDIFAELRPLLVTSIVTIRRLIVAYVPDDGLGRNLAYAAIKPRLEEALVTFNDTFALRLSAALEQLQSTTLGMAFDRMPGDSTAFVYLSADQWLDEVRVFGGWTLREYFRRRSPSQFMKEIMRLIDRVVQRGILQNLRTDDIARQIVPETVTRSGRPSLAIRVGTVLSNIRNRVEGTIAQAVWAVATHSERLVWRERDVEQWVWTAVLDTRTCPICSPLDGVTRPARNAFPYQPPVHPNCRCRILPFTLT